MPLTWSVELEELKRALRSMSSDFATEADQYAEGAAKGAATAVRQVYSRHWVTGMLATRVYASRYLRRKVAVGWQVVSRAPHAWLFEHTTKPRFYVTKPGKTPGSGGKIHATGRMWKGSPPPETFVPTLMQFRRDMYEQLKDMLQRAGLHVSGDA
jgi:hypothetical protein